MKRLRVTAFLASYMAMLAAVSSAQAVVRDSVEISIQGQTRLLRLVSDDARVERRMACGANPTGVTLEGRFRLEMVRPDGSICGKIALGAMAYDHGDGWDRRKALILNDYDGDGHRWEVSFEGGGACSIGADRSIVGYDGVSGKLTRHRFRLAGGTIAQTVNSSRYPAAVSFAEGCLKVRWYTNAGEHPPYGWVADVFSFDQKSNTFRFIKTVQDQRPDPWPEWPFM